MTLRVEGSKAFDIFLSSVPPTREPTNYDLSDLDLTILGLMNESTVVLKLLVEILQRFRSVSGWGWRSRSLTGALGSGETDFLRWQHEARVGECKAVLVGGKELSLKRPCAV